VSKHAAVAFAEWLSITYGARGVRVSCLCPMGVRTPLLEGGFDLDGEGGLGARAVAAAGEVLDPSQVADLVVEALREERFLVLPHPEVLTFFQRKAADYDRWLAGMRRLQDRLTAPG
jgi:NAD(P)-dependent dehydrogenase (short-subunit alcohol dehydrogenase family)